MQIEYARIFIAAIRLNWKQFRSVVFELDSTWLRRSIGELSFFLAIRDFCCYILLWSFHVQRNTNLFQMCRQFSLWTNEGRALLRTKAQHKLRLILVLLLHLLPTIIVTLLLHHRYSPVRWQFCYIFTMLPPTLFRGNGCCVLWAITDLIGEMRLRMLYQAVRLCHVRVLEFFFC